MQRDFAVSLSVTRKAAMSLRSLRWPGVTRMARSLDEPVARVQEAIAVCLEDADAGALPALEFTGFQRVTVSA